MDTFLQLVVSGVATGAIYALAAMGFTLLWQTSGTINFAQGEFVMIPAFVMLAFIGLAGANLWVAFFGTIVFSSIVFGAGFKRAVVDPMIRHGVLPLVVATLGLAIALKNLVKATYSAEAQSFPRPFPDDVFSVAGVRISTYDVGVLVVAGAVLLALNVFITRTTTGRAMQASAQNPDAARVLGIDVPRMILYTFVINAVLATTAALLVAPVYLAKFDMGEPIGLKAFFAAIIGGFSQTRGALLGGVLVGVLENLAAAYISPAYKDAVAMVLFTIVILFKPEGLLGKPEERKV